MNCKPIWALVFDAIKRSLFFSVHSSIGYVMEAPPPNSTLLFPAMSAYVSCVVSSVFGETVPTAVY